MKVSKGASTIRTALDEMQRPETTDAYRWFLLAFVLDKMCEANMFLDPDKDHWPKPKPSKPKRWFPRFQR